MVASPGCRVLKGALLDKAVVAPVVFQGQLPPLEGSMGRLNPPVKESDTTGLIPWGDEARRN